MTNNSKNTEYLPAIAPDLVLVRRGHGEWQAQGLSDRLLLWLQTDYTQAHGRSPAALFPAPIQPISSLFNEVLDQGQDLNGVKLRLLPQQPECLTNIQFAGLTEDYLGQLMRVSLRSANYKCRYPSS